MFLLLFEVDLYCFNLPLSTAFLNPIGFGFPCFHFHLFLCIFWFLPWSIGYSEASYLASIFNRFFFFFPLFSSVTQPYLTLCNPMDCSTPGFPAHHQLQKLTQTHFHRVSDAIQPFHPLSSPSSPTLTFHSIRVFTSESGIHIRW